jgi:hypothetical protein
VARFVLVGGGCRGLALARGLAGEGDAVRVTTRSEERRGVIERAGAECWRGDPDRVGTLRDALEGATVLCWLLGNARGSEEQVAALHGSRLAMMLARTVDTTVRGVLYEAAGTVPATTLARGEEVTRAAGARWGIPVAVLRTPPAAQDQWVREAHAGLRALVGRRPASSG